MKHQADQPTPELAEEAREWVEAGRFAGWAMSEALQRYAEEFDRKMMEEFNGAQDGLRKKAE